MRVRDRPIHVYVLEYVHVYGRWVCMWVRAVAGVSPMAADIASIAVCVRTAPPPICQPICFSTPKRPSSSNAGRLYVRFARVVDACAQA